MGSETVIGVLVDILETENSTLLGSHGNSYHSYLVLIKTFPCQKKVLMKDFPLPKKGLG